MPTILIIDDEEALCLTLEDFFIGQGFRVHLAHDGAQGVRVARAHHPDIILSDIRMPGIGGHEAVVEFRKIPGLALTPIILFTGNADLTDMRKGMDAGADDYLFKPVKLSELRQTVQRHLDRGKLRSEAARSELVALHRDTGALLPGNLADPLHEIIGCASVMEVEAEVMSRPEISEFARNIINGAETLNQRFENFLLYSRLQSNSLVINPPAETDIQELISQLTKQIARRHHHINTLRLDLDPVIANVSSELLAKAVAEAVDNACRYPLPSEPIDVLLKSKDGKWVITVTDYGMGIPEYQLNDATENPQVQGYGLKLSRLLTEALGGSWVLDNQPKRGVTVTFTFPLV